MPKFEKHIFICGNQRPAGHPRGCCDPEAKANLQKAFKQKLAERGLKGKIRANQAGCLDQCEHGPNLVIYPEAAWYGRVNLADVDEIIDSTKWVQSFVWDPSKDMAMGGASRGIGTPVQNGAPGFNMNPNNSGGLQNQIPNNGGSDIPPLQAPPPNQ